MAAAYYFGAPLIPSAEVSKSAKGEAKAEKSAPPIKKLDVKVDVSTPVEREVIDSLDFAARMTAIDYVEVRAHVWGYLNKVNFKEGDMVKSGDILFELDARVYENQLHQAKANVAQVEAKLKFDEADLERSKKVLNAISKSDLEKAISARDLDLANLELAKESVKQSELLLEYSKIAAPITGRTSAYKVTTGNLVQSGDQNGGTLLTTIVSVDPIYAYFDVDEGAVLRNMNLVRDGKAQPFRNLGAKVRLRLDDGGKFSREGTIDFVDNQINPKTGTLRMRASFANKDESLTPGLFSTVTLPIGNKHRALLVRESALDNDQGSRVLCILNGNNIVERRRVVVGGKHDGLVEIESGLRAGEKVIVKGVQLAQGGTRVEPDMQNSVPMLEETPK
ncbi:efflux RND transporter periplasmic adaptor subunit [Telmatocola sphagniphila]|uniref:Efflux RND transporter periplasmic adaptor subunit n=1 Tax=Telmatocola sphagniphila TaxID=1123043 RepID=A0A8E6B942_9BACT|nr:efflux RND transporter periplasmic adaptor subunit [Telmatocola sphagniphila]QVL34137.1 efflux RND transporter periplasmic adaptor subunit [Telmatocola sphagniphila]